MFGQQFTPAAIQGLHQLVREKDRLIRQLEVNAARTEMMRAELDGLRRNHAAVDAKLGLK